MRRLLANRLAVATGVVIVIVAALFAYYRTAA